VETTGEASVVGTSGSLRTPARSTVTDSPTKPAATQKNTGTGTLGKALEVLDVIALSTSPVRFTDILNNLQQPRGTLHRQISNLIEEGLVQVNADGTYSAGLRLLKLAARTWSQNSFRLIAEPHVRNLHQITGETVHLGVMSDLEVIYVDKLESVQSVRMHSQVGNASPLYCTGIGKAMLALLPEDECDAKARNIQYKQHTQHTLHTPDLLLEDIADIRHKGVAHDDTISQWEDLVQQAARAIESDIAAGMGPRSQE